MAFNSEEVALHTLYVKLLLIKLVSGLNLFVWPKVASIGLD